MKHLYLILALLTIPFFSAAKEYPVHGPQGSLAMDLSQLELSGRPDQSCKGNDHRFRLLENVQI